MLTIDEIQERLKVFDVRALSKEIGVHENTIYKIKNGSTNASYKTIKRISDYMESLTK